MTRHVFVCLLASCALSACASNPQPAGPSASAAGPSAPPAPGLAAENLVGSWGYAAYHNEPDRPRTIAQARGHCGQPYVIAPAPNGGVMMHLADTSQAVEVRSKLGPDGRRYIGTDGPAGDPLDREVVAFDGQLMLLRWVDKDVSSRYGTMVYVRCGARGTRGARVSSAAKPR